MARIDPADWRPAGGITLEDAAKRVVTSTTNCSVIAGPGAGKTELLAQRALYLLQTGQCPPPRRILAISFKRDAALNLKDRVGRRCTPQQAERFDSFTFDGFAKSLVDRFLALTPTWCQPPRDYAIVFPGRDDWQQFQRGLQPPSELGDAYDVQALKLAQVERWGPLPNNDQPATTLLEWVARQWWMTQLRGRNPALSFAMIGRLAEAILAYNPNVLMALRLTYSHVFLDEFQDTTKPQFDLAAFAFEGSSAIVTAVGDTKQRIMTWAGAEAEVFGWFEARFRARREMLQMNHRSNARIVQIINDLVKEIEPQAVETICAREDKNVPERAAEFWIFGTDENEAKAIAHFIAADIELDPDRKPDDFAILVRVRANEAEKQLRDELVNRGLRLRNEARSVEGIAIQDLMADDLVCLLCAVLRLGVGVRGHEVYSAVQSALGGMQGANYDNPSDLKQLDTRLRRLMTCVRDLTAQHPKDTDMASLIDAVVDELGSQRLRQAYRQYDNEKYFYGVQKSFSALMAMHAADVPDWKALFDAVEGKNQVRLLTVHKSKGLEYHTVVFMGLHENAFFGYRNNAAEETSAFFVGLSRARERIYFTRSIQSGGTQRINGLIELLKGASVPTIHAGN